MARYTAPPGTFGGPPLIEAEITVRGLEVTDVAEADEEVRKLLAPGYEIRGENYEYEYFGGRSLGAMTVTAKIVQTRGDPMALSPEVEIHFDLALSPSSVEDATSIGAFIDECRGYISERMRHYKMHGNFTVTTELPGYDPPTKDTGS